MDAATILMPPSNPFVAVLEQEVALMLFVSIAWAYVTGKFHIRYY